MRVLIFLLALIPSLASALDMAQIEAKAAEIRAEKEKKLNELFQSAKGKVNYQSVQPSTAQEAEALKLVDTANKQIPSGASAWDKLSATPKPTPKPTQPQQQIPTAPITKKESLADRGYIYVPVAYQSEHKKRGCLGNGRCWYRVGNKRLNNSVN